MNRKQIICLWIGIVVFITIGFFPPWKWTPGNLFLGHGFILDPSFKYPYNKEKSFSPCDLRIDTTVLYVQWIMVAVITGGLLLTFQGKKKD
jgi:hypothetical protein